MQLYVRQVSSTGTEQPKQSGNDPMEYASRSEQQAIIFQDCNYICKSFHVAENEGHFTFYILAVRSTLRKSNTKYNWPYLVSFCDRKYCVTASRSYWNINVPKSRLSYSDPMKHRKKPFSCFVLNPCYITPCFINQCFITPCFINQFFITPCFINQFFITPCFINSCFVTPCFINPCFVNPVQSIFYDMPINTRCP